MQHLAAVPSGMLSFAQDRLLDVESTQDARPLATSISDTEPKGQNATIIFVCFRSYLEFLYA